MQGLPLGSTGFGVWGLGFCESVSKFLVFGWGWEGYRVDP